MTHAPSLAVLAKWGPRLRGGQLAALLRTVAGRSGALLKRSRLAAAPPCLGTTGCIRGLYAAAAAARAADEGEAPAPARPVYARAGLTGQGLA